MINTKFFIHLINPQRIIITLMLIFAYFMISENVAAQLNLETNFNAKVNDALASVITSAVQPDGKILVGGGFRYVNGIEYINLARLNTDGSLDNSFNSGGSGANGSVFEVSILPGGKILIGGGFTAYNGVAKSGLVRLNPDGTLDTTFNVGGTGVTGTVQTIALQTDGKILVSGGGISAYNGTTKFSVIRINADGTLDNSFSSSFTSATSVEEVDVQTDGKILIGGIFNSYGGVTRRGVARLNSDGTLDTSFNPENTQRSVAAMTLQPDGKVLIGGAFRDNEGSELPLIARLNVDGSTDVSFTPPALGNDGYAEYFAIQPDGKILVTGRFDINNLNRVPLLRLNANGTLDNTFTLQTTDTNGYHVRLQLDGKILLVGNFSRYGNSNRNGIVRLNSNGSIDNSFNVSITSYGVVNVIVQQPDGKILVGGNFRTANGTPNTNLARFNIDGTLDTTFNTGTGTGNDSSSGNVISAIAVQTDGKILIDGRFGSFNGTIAQGIIRLNNNGSVDTSFNVTGLAESFIIINDIHAQSDGKVLVGVGGSVLLANNFQPVYLFRLNSNGSVDPTFNSGNTGPNSTVNKIVRRTDGKLIIGGAFSNYNGTSRNRIALINPDGTLDTSFNPGTGANSTVRDIALQSDGKVLIGGLFTSFNAVLRNRIARLNADGSLDISFDPRTGADNAVTSIALQSDGKIFIGGQFSNYNGTAQNKLARLNGNGNLDSTFVSGLSNNPNFFVNKLLFQTDGKLLVGGVFNSYNGIPRGSLARLSTTVLSRTLFDFDGDGKTDISIFRPSVGEWWYLKSSSGGNGAFQFGSASDKMIPADYTGDGKSDFAFFRPSTGEWFVLRSEDSSFYSFPFGTSGDIPVPADFDADGKADPAVFRPSTNTWFISKSTGGTTIQAFGAAGDVPVVADYDGDNKADIAIYRASLGEWWIQRSSLGAIAFQFGNSSDKAVQGDFTGDGKADVAFWRPQTGEWFVLRSENQTYYSFPFGTNGDIPSPGDYDGDGRFDAAVFRPSNNTWFVQRSSSGTLIQTFGQTGDKSVPNSFVP